MATTLLAQERQRRLRHPQRTEEVSLHLRSRLPLAELLDHAELAVSRVVDHDIEPAEVVVSSGDRVEHRLAGGDVEGERRYGVAVFVRQIPQRRRVAGGRGHLVAAFQGGDGPLAAEAARRAGDEPDLGCHETPLRYGP